MARTKAPQTRDKHRFLVACLKEEKDFITKVARKNGIIPTVFVREAALEKAKKLFDKNKTTYIREALEVLGEIDKDNTESH